MMRLAFLARRINPQLPVKHSFSQFHSAFFSSVRIKTTYSENITAARALPVSHAVLHQKKNDPTALTIMARDHIIEHAARRVDLFFYILIAYFKTQKLPELGRTYLQHGIGRSFITQACHSSFIASLVDYDKNSESILTGTHLMDSINSTVELPGFVNDFDYILENHYDCRKKSLRIIQQVSLEQFNPVEGLNQFLRMMVRTFNEIKKAKMNFSDALIDTVKMGTLAGIYSDTTQSVTKEYIELLLRLSPEEKKYRNKEKIYLSKMAEIKQEILNTKSQFKNSKLAR
jgi:hypothetical protein